MCRDARSPPASSPSTLRLIHRVSFSGLAIFAAAVLALHGLRTGLNPAEHTVSEYSLGSWGWLMRGAFGALGIGVLAIALSLQVTMERSSWRRLGLLLVVGTAIGLFLDAGYNTDHPRVAETPAGTVHGFGMLLICITLPAAAFVLGLGLIRGSRLAIRARWVLVLGAADLVSILGFEMSPTTSRGLTERLAVAFAVATLALLRSLALSPVRENAEAPQYLRAPEVAAP